MGTPPGVSEADFAAALARFEAVVGKDWVFSSDEDVALYRDAYSPWWGEGEERMASAAVAPDSVEQVQAIMKIANEFKIPVYPFSTGKNLTYGGSAPVLSGSVILELRRMNRILEISEQNACVLVEPGVTYFDLYRHIREQGLKLWIDCPDPGWGSLVGNALDHGAGRTALPYRDHFEAHCGMEIVMADGELVRTGMGALPGAKSWQQFRDGVGPIVDGLFAQSNFGVVTKMGFWLMPEPEAALTCSAAVRRRDDIGPFVAAMADLIYRGIIPSQTGVVSPVMGDWRKARAGDDSAQAADAFAASRNLPFWTSEFTFYGPPAVIQAQSDYARSRLLAIPGATYAEGARYSFPLTDAQVRDTADKHTLGIPSLEIFTSRRFPGSPPLEGHMDFSPIVPIDGPTILEALEVFGRVFDEAGVAPLGGVPEFYHMRAMTIIYAIPTGKDPATNRKVRETFSKLIEAAAAHGWGEYRVHPAVMDEAVGAYSFNNHALRRLHERLKDAVDPNGILSAGRYGIWPRHIRETRA